VFDSGASQTANIPNLPGGLAQEGQHWIALHYLDPETNEGIAGADYEIHFAGGPMLTGTLDQDGKARHENVLNKPVKKIVYKPRKPASSALVPRLEEILKG
jgi:type VI secretion system secreted protein VgrG